MAQANDNLDFSGLFKLDVLVHLDISTYSFYEVGLKKFLAFSSDKELVFFYIDSQKERYERYYDWDFVDNPVYCMCFEPSGTWLLILSDQKVLLVPFLPLFIPQNNFDHKWSLSSVTVLPIGHITKPTSVVWWLTKESENILIIGSKVGTITFYSLESQSIVGECKVSGEIVDLQMCFDDSLDLLALLISKSKSQQWKLVLEHRSFGYNWLHQIRSQSDKDKRDSFMSYIRQLSKDKITLFIQGGSKDDNKSQTVEYLLKPSEYLPLFRKGSNNWALTAQYVNGRHFLTALELNEGTLILESPDEDTPSRTLRPRIKKDGLYIQGLWSQRLVYLLRKNELEVHSANFSVIQGDGLLGAKREFSELWSAELIGEVRRAHLMSSREPPPMTGGWREPSFLCDLQLPRFNLEPCLVVTNCGAYILNTVCEPCEWLVGVMTRGGAGAEQAAAALGAPLPALLRAAADLLMSRGKVAPAHYLYSLSQVVCRVRCEPCEWLVGVMTRGGAGAEQAAAALGAPLPALLRAAADLLMSRGKVAPAHYLYSLSQVVCRVRCEPCEWLVGVMTRGGAGAEQAAAALGAPLPALLRAAADLLMSRGKVAPAHYLYSLSQVVCRVRCEPCEWLVGVMTRGGAGAEQAAAALGAPLPALLRAAADLLMSRGKVAPAHYLYSLSQSQPDGWVARLGMFGRLHELCMFKQTGNIGSLGNAATTLKLLALLLKMGTNHVEKFEPDVKFTSLTSMELSELSSISAAVGLWDMLPTFSIHRGQPHLVLAAIKARNDICRGALNCLLEQKCLIPLLLEKNSQWLFDFITERCNKFDTIILKRICLWLNPLQDQLRPILRDMRQWESMGIVSVYTTRILRLISTFMQVACEIEARHPCPDIHLEVTQNPETWKNQFVPRRTISCGLSHWSVVDDGDAMIMIADTPIKTNITGRVIDVACGRHHTLVLTENGVYSAGDNSYGQLGAGRSWAGAVGDAASASGALLHVPFEWTAPLVGVSAGHYHSAAIDAGGRLYTWGWGVHGQLGLGSIDDECSPKIVTKLQGRKVLTVGCGACHTVMLMKNGEVWACGAAVFGQLGSGNREKSSVPVRVMLPDAVDMIAVGYFHNLALTTKGTLYIWGASPQQVRAAHARRASSPTAPACDPPLEPHLVPAAVDASNVRARIVQLAAGWHHSCVLDNFGTIYSWGLNFDGQLGSGDRKQVLIPSEVRIRDEAHPNKGNAKTPDDENKEFRTRALVACGGDFTVYVDDDGRIYAAGNHQQANNEKEKGSNRVIMMKTTKRVIKIPASRTGNKFVFQHVVRIDAMLLFDVIGSQKKPIEPRQNPLVGLSDFNRKSWADDLILLLKPWINETDLSGNLNMSAKFAFHNKIYYDCLKLLLENLKSIPREDCLYLTHTDVDEDLDKENDSLQKKEEFKIIITNIMSKRIKDVSLSILNEAPYPAVNLQDAMFKSLPCCCDEFKYLPKELTPHEFINISDPNLSTKAAAIIDKCMSIFPVDTNLWENCFRQSKDFFIENNLSISELETVLRKYMETNATTMAAAIMYSNDCSQYSEILSPKFYLNMCSQVLDTWG